MKRLLLAMGLALSLSACGFHLQDGASIPPTLAGLRVEGNGPAGGSLAQATARALEREGNYPQKTGPVLRIDNAGISQRIISISPTSGAAVEFLNTLRAEISVVGADGKTLLPPQPLLLENSFSFNSANPLATSEQQNTAQRTMLRQAAQQILARVLNSPRFREARP
ncbi:MAG: LPS assembly lipoprotein LptE [Acidithiobacillus sp.]|uniref:LPS-assembly lipoprotein LptE n=1 Tax=Acidithiobacillus sp. TaxID=1872118 RepID=UPI003D02103F